MNLRERDTPGPPANPQFTPVSGSSEFAAAALEVVSSARHDLALMTVDLDRRVFAGEDFTTRLRGFVLQHRRARFRVLVHEPVQAVRNSIRLVEFSRLLSSRIEFRQVPAGKQTLREEYLIADERALLYRSAPNQLEGKHYPEAPMVARSHLRAFDAIWQEATVAREFSSLGL